MASIENVEVDASKSKAKFEKTEKADYSSVVFCNVARSYPTDAHVVCQYQITPSLKANKWDWIGLFRVGWIQQSDKQTYMWVHIPSNYKDGESAESSVMFQAHHLPKEDGEFYQFCYMSSSHQVRGASTPFQFRKPGYDEFVEMEDADVDMLVISSKTVALEEGLKKADAEKQEAIKKLAACEADRNSLVTKAAEGEQKLIVEQEKVQALELKLKKAEEETKRHHVEAADMGMVRDTLKEKMDKLTKERDDAIKQHDDSEILLNALKEQIKSLNTEMDTLKGKLSNLEQEKEVYKTHFSESEGTVQAYTLEIDHLKKASCNQETHNKKLVTENGKLKMGLEEETKRRKRIEDREEASQEVVKALQERIVNLEDKTRAFEQQKLLMGDELMAVKEAHEDMSQCLEHAKTESHSLKVKIAKDQARFDNEKGNMDKEVQGLRANLDGIVKENEDLRSECSSAKDKVFAMESQKHDAAEGSLYALQMALSSLKESYKQSSSRCQELSKKNKQLEQCHGEDQSQIKDLVERHEMCRKEYETKYIECEKLLKTHDKLKAKYSVHKSVGLSEEVEIPIVIETESPQGSSATTTPPNTPQERALADDIALSLSSKEIQLQLEMMAKELEQRQSKKNKYKQLFQTQKDKSDFLDRHYTEQYSQFQAQLEEEQAKSRNLQQTLESKEAELMELMKRCSMGNKTVQDGTSNTVNTATSVACTNTVNAATSVASTMAVPNTSAVETMAVPNTSAAETMTVANTTSAETMTIREIPIETTDGFTQMFPNPYTESGNIHIVRPPPTTTYRNPYTTQVEQGDASDNKKATTRDNVSPQDTSSNTEAKSELDVSDYPENLKSPLTPLPAPISPEVLPTARVTVSNSHQDPAMAENMGYSFIQDEPSDTVTQHKEQTAEHPDETSVVQQTTEHTNEMSVSDMPPTIHRTEEQEDEERFFDSEGEPQKSCPVCSMIFPLETDQRVIEEHVDAHLGNECPMCKKTFDRTVLQQEFEEHVQSHFDHM